MYNKTNKQWDKTIKYCEKCLKPMVVPAHQKYSMLCLDCAMRNMKEYAFISPDDHNV